MGIHKIDGVNWVERDIPFGEGTVRMVGMTVRALRAALEKCDPDDLVCYMAENTPETRASDLLLGVFGGVLSEGNCGATFIVGPEAVRAMKEQGVFE
jgi:hypothetical protein